MKSLVEPIRDILLKWLRMKTSFLVAVTSARRISELCALSCKSDLCIFHWNKVVLFTNPTVLRKIPSKFHRSQEIYLPSFYPRPSHPKEHTWHNLDVRRALKAFLIRTEHLRKTDFVSIIPPNVGKKMSKSAIGFAIKFCITEAYKALHIPVPTGITAHSVNALVEEICKMATWSSVSTFIQHYKVTTIIQQMQLSAEESSHT